MKTTPPRRETSAFKTSAFKTLRAVSPIIILAVLIVIVRSFLNLPVSEFYQWFEAFKESPYSIAIVVLTFIVGSFLAVPQWALYVGMVTVFGPVLGGFTAWGATLTSASTNFFIGRLIGYNRLGRFIKADGRVASFMQRLKKDGFMASFVVRFIPTGPFIIVNMLAGASGLQFLSFVLGTALGIIPKIIIIALLTQGLISEADSLAVTVVFMMAAIFIALMTVWLRRRYGKLE